MYGSIKVEGYSGSTVKIVVEKYVKGTNLRALEQGRKEIGVKVVQIEDRIYIYLDSPYSSFNEETGRFRHNENNSGRMYKYTLDFKIKVPVATNVELTAINNGDIHVSDIQAKEIVANNINGAITLNNIAGQTYANALNKDINISYTSNPQLESHYKSLNGDINITVPNDLNADVFFQSLNGGFYTNFETSSLKSNDSTNKVSGTRGVKYKLNTTERFRIGNGGVKLSFDLLNGDVTVKK